MQKVAQMSLKMASTGAGVFLLAGAMAIGFIVFRVVCYKLQKVE